MIFKDFFLSEILKLNNTLMQISESANDWTESAVENGTLRYNKSKT